MCQVMWWWCSKRRPRSSRRIATEGAGLGWALHPASTQALRYGTDTAARASAHVRRGGWSSLSLLRCGAAGDDERVEVIAHVLVRRGRWEMAVVSSAVIGPVLGSSERRS